MWKCGSGLFAFRKRWHPRNLDYLDKSHCSLTTVTEDILRHAGTLEELSLEGNQLTDLPKGIFRMTKLRRLILADNEIQDLTNDISSLIALEELDFSKNDVRVVPDSIQNCKKLTFLDISSNTLGELPDSLTKLNQLKTWIANDIALTEIPPEIGSLSNLVVLELRENCIKFLPLSFSFLSKLERLDLGGNELEELPDTIGQLTCLIELWLDNNFLTTLPSEIGELKALQCLDVSENRIEELPEEISTLTSLTDLHCTSNALHELPQGIGCLIKLQILKVDQNEIDEITDCIGGCTNLLEVVLSENVIEFLPAAIGKLSNLTLLNIDRNRLFTFPPEIGNCTKLSVLSARDNQIVKIPKEIGSCKSLTVLSLSGNKLESLPFAVSTLPLKALWLSQNQSQSVLKLQVEDDEITSEKILTCFLFPQEKLKCSSIDDLDKDFEPEHEKSETQTAVKFPETAVEKESNLQRHDTPYPKELRSRHPHLIRKRSQSPESEHSRPVSATSATLNHVNLPEEKSVTKQTDQINTSVKLNLQSGVDNSAVLNGIDNSVVTNGIDNLAALSGNSAEEEHSEENSSEDSSSDDEDGKKRIRFNVEENVNDEHCKLFRKDTPHFLKGKRIVQDSGGFQEILSIIEQNKNHSVDHENEEKFSKECTFENVEAVMNGKKKNLRKYKRQDTPTINNFSKSLPVQKPSGGLIFEEEEEGSEDVDEEEDNDEEVCEDDNEDDNEANEDIENETVTKVYEELSTLLTRDGQSLGINIAGGIGTNTFQEDEQLVSSGSNVDLFLDEGIFITKVVVDGPAYKDGVLKVGDKIIKVNGVDISNYNHKEAVAVLKESGDKVQLVVLREVTDEDQINLALNNQREKSVRFAAEPEVEDIEIETLTIPVVLIRDAKGLGFSIAGGKGANPYNNKNDEGIYISKITDNGPAALDNRLQVGDRLLSINNVDVREAKHDDVVKILVNATEKVSLVAHRERVIHKKMKPLSQINGNVKTIGETTKVELIPDERGEEPKLLVEEILLKKTSGPLGMSIVGGSDVVSHPFGVNEPGIFVSKIMSTGEAAKTNLCIGDRILRVNDKDMRRASHQEAVAALISNDPEIKLLVRHDPPPPGLKEVKISKKLGEKLGISIRGGAKGHPGNPFDKDDEGIFISKVNSSGAASRDGRLKVGMRILEVNGISLLGATHVDAVRALRTAGDILTTVVCDGYDEQAASVLIEENIFFNPSLCESRFSPDSQSSATSGDLSDGGYERITYHHHNDQPKVDESYKEAEILAWTRVERSSSEQRTLDAEKRAKLRQETIDALDTDARKAKQVITKSKELSTSSLENSLIDRDILRERNIVGSVV
ncbi:protein scribble homolog isoform X1 [Hydra vulgaris]|uniref:protein scribble homolog isoform X1 n=1 Tax=Hydra vulgaris TaxID=6087 RepID=UPI0006414179|nr:protein scribble homolog isoform X1 [Hydra vulgaris]